MHKKLNKVQDNVILQFKFLNIITIKIINT